MAKEFDLIHKYFAPLAGPEGLELKDDAACLKPQFGQELVVTKDMLVEGVHFFGNDPASSIAHKSLVANLSDLAAKGATPTHYFLGLSLPTGIGDDWLAEFSGALAALQKRSGIRLSGGDTTGSHGGVTVSITALGTVPAGGMIRRSGAQIGDLVFVTGALGGAALGLKCLNSEIKRDEDLVLNYRYPEARTELGIALASHVNACADISDGLLADLGHITVASGLGADVRLTSIPRSIPVQKVLAEMPEHESCIYAGGDDYELVFTSSRSNQKDIERLCLDLGVPLAVVGEITAAPGVRLVDQNGKLVHTGRSGFQHFET